MGNTSSLCAITAIFSVHPHMRGEYVVSKDQVFAAVGSHPHTWGILGPSWNPSARHRFTPTYVGNTPLIPQRPAALSVHPHIRGEYTLTSTLNKVDIGSPPHAWGILAISVADRGGPPVHPHIRGEYNTQTFSGTTNTGSPPHTWGIRTPRPK